MIKPDSGVLGIPEFSVKLDRYVGILGTQDLWLVSEVRVVLWDWAVKPLESDANYSELLSEKDWTIGCPVSVRIGKSQVMSETPFSINIF